MFIHFIQYLNTSMLIFAHNSDYTLKRIYYLNSIKKGTISPFIYFIYVNTLILVRIHKHSSRQMHYLKQELLKLLVSDERIFDFFQEAGIWTWDLINPENQWMSQSFWETLGYQVNEIPNIFQGWQTLIHPEDIQLVEESLQAHLENSTHPFEAVIRYLHKNGSLVWIRCRGIAIRDETGRALRMLVSHVDITKEKEAELKARQESLLFQYITNSELLYIAKTDLEGKYTFVSEYYAKVLGRSVESLVGTFASEDVIQTDIPVGMEAYKACIQQPEVPFTVLLRKNSTLTS
ncbi:hypothetical protein BWI93_13590 [Siphonobacter sp. BAB-5385]|nr:hypothetical protein BWI93_13590 [Siphonobacter sp. BAB-5385]